MKKIALLMIALLAVPLFLTTNVDAQATPEASEIHVGLEGNHVSVTWVTDIATTGWIEYTLDTPGNTSTSVADVRDEEITSSTERIEAYSHQCVIDLSFNDKGRDVYIEVFGGNDEELTTSHIQFEVPMFGVDVFPHLFPVSGLLSNGITGVADAIVTVNVTRGSETTSSVSAVAGSTGGYGLNTANGIYWDDITSYVPQAGDIIGVKVNAGPLGTQSLSQPVTTGDIAASSVSIAPINFTIPYDLSDIVISPTTGDNETDFTFSFTVTTDDGNAPDSVELVLDGAVVDMSSMGSGTDYDTGVDYSYTTQLTAGDHEYYVVVDQDGIIVSTDNTASGAEEITVTAAGTVDPEDDDDDSNTLLIVALVVIVALVLLGVMMVQKKK